MALYFESPTAQRLFLSTPHICNEPTTHTQEHMAPSSVLLDASVPCPTAEQPTTSSNTKDTHSSLPKRPEILRHVFPRPSRSRTYTRKAVRRINKAESPDHALTSRRPRSRVAFHRYIAALFGGASDRTATIAIPETRSRASSFGSKPESPRHGPVPSLDFVTPAAFMFSGPSLHSAGSYSDSTSRLPSLAESSSEMQLWHRVRTDSFSIIDDANTVVEVILEPEADQGITRAVSHVLLDSNASTQEANLLPQNNRQVAAEHSITKSGCRSTSTFASLLLPHLDTSAYKALRLTNRAWYLALCVAAPPISSKSFHLPVEILHCIYNYLGPKDFNAARHTCRDWMRASLDKNLLITMLSRGGWLSTIDNKAFTNCPATQYPADSTTPSSEEWLLSCRISRECALAPGWTGNGFTTGAVFAKSFEVDFTELTDGFANGIIFASSLCSRFLCVARGALIYIYNLERGHPVPITSVVCPRRVLAISMDVSCGRHAIAALLEGRMGIVCELGYGVATGEKNAVDPLCESSGQQASDLHMASADTNLTSEQSRPFIQERDDACFDAIYIRSNNQKVSLRGTDNDRNHDQHLINRAWNLDFRGSFGIPKAQTSESQCCTGSIPIESGTSTIYRHLCSEDDPPRSVSICPQRRCVAFGCSAGIELHWIDALTGQSLSRWFPLTAPSQCVPLAQTIFAHIEQATTSISCHLDLDLSLRKSCV